MRKETRILALPALTALAMLCVAAASAQPLQAPKGSFAERYAQFIGIFDDLPEDFAEQHDHYIHGTPRK